MHKGLATLLMVTIVFGGGYWYYTASALCDIPVTYRIGSIDPRFELSPEEARSAVSSAESLWEDATGKNLFTHDESASFVVNFVYDGRQEFTNAEQSYNQMLAEQREMSDEVRAQYEELIEEYEELKERYAEQSDSYEDRLQAHNREVARWNDEGGAPEEVYEQLNNRREELAGEQRELNNIAHQLNTLVDDINALGEEGNVLVQGYNGIVEAYNARFGQEREFTQGDYQRDGIHIYQFEDREELVLVLTHELGHALSLSHVEGTDSIMHHLMGGQSLETGITDSDLEVFRATCGA